MSEQSGNIGTVSHNRRHSADTNVDAQLRHLLFGAPRWRASKPRQAAAPKPTVKDSAFVYAIRVGEFVKIGTAIDVQKRLVGIQTCNPHAVELLGAAEQALRTAAGARLAMLRAQRIPPRCAAPMNFTPVLSGKGE